MADEPKGPDMNVVLGVLGVIVLGAAALFLGPNFGTMLSNLQGAGFFSYLLPFLLVFAVVYAALKMAKLVDDMTSLIIALVVALFSLLFLSTVPIVAFLAFFLGRIGIVIVILLVVYLFYGYMVKVGAEEKKK